MSNRFLFIAFAAVVVTALLTAYVGGPAESVGVSMAFLGFIGKALGTVVKTVGSVVGIGGGSDKPIQVTTQTDPSLKAAVEANAQAVAALANSSKPKSTIPTWVWIVGGVVGFLFIGGVTFAVVRRRG